MNACSWKAPLVTLHDGRQVPSDSEDWRHECEAQAIIALPTVSMCRAALRGTLDGAGKLRGGILEKRGEAAVQRLEETIKRIWYANRGQDGRAK